VKKKRRSRRKGGKKDWRIKFIWCGSNRVVSGYKPAKVLEKTVLNKIKIEVSYLAPFDTLWKARIFGMQKQNQSKRKLETT
jgi:hypothetical protein